MFAGLMPFFSAKYVLIMAASMAMQERVLDKFGMSSGKEISAKRTHAGQQDVN